MGLQSGKPGVSSMQSTPTHNQIPDACDMAIAIVTSRYHEDITTALRDGAVEAFIEAGGDSNRLVHIEAPGTWELPVLCRALLQRGAGAPDAVIALGCVVAGETSHDRYINHGVSSALSTLAIETGCPVAFGVITCSTMDQARARAGGDRGNKGREAMHAAIETVNLIRTTKSTATLSP